MIFGAIVVVLVVVVALFGPRAPSVTAAMALLLQAPVNSEHGSAIVRCSRPGLFGLLATTAARSVTPPAISTDAGYRRAR
jgi:hypothetical protein